MVGVVGSNPIVPTKFKKAQHRWAFLLPVPHLLIALVKHFSGL